MYRTLLLIVCCCLNSAALSGQSHITFWLGSSTDPREEKGYQELVNEFNQQNPNVQVRIEKVPGSETDAAKMMTAVRSGAGPDVYLLDRFTVAQRAASGLLKDLGPYLKKEGKDLSHEYLDFAW